MSFCRKCGIKLKDDALYCNKCGSKIETDLPIPDLSLKESLDLVETLLAKYTEIEDLESEVKALEGRICHLREVDVKELEMQKAQLEKELEEAIAGPESAEDIIRESEMIRDTLLPKMNALRLPCDEAETLTAREYWPYPTYGDLLFGVK